MRSLVWRPVVAACLVLLSATAAVPTPGADNGLVAADLSERLVLVQGPGVAWCDDVALQTDQDALVELGCDTREIRPGAWGGGCTLNFVVTDGADYWIGTAGHCGNVGRAFHVPGVGRVGEVVFREFNGNLLNFRDWAFVKVDEAKESLVSGRMYRYGGPFAATDDLLTRPPAVGDLAFQYGHGAGWGQEDGTRGRVAQVEALFGTTAFGYLGTVGGGDSGSPLRFATGEAAGIAVAYIGFATGDNREMVHAYCENVDRLTGLTDVCLAYDAACPELDGTCAGPFGPGAAYGLVVATRFDAAKAAFDEWLGHATTIVPGELPGVGVA